MDVIRIHVCHVSFGEIKTLLEMLALEKAAFRSLRANLGAVLGNTFQTNQAFRKENTEHLLHQILQCTAVSDSEITQRVVIHYLHTGQPLKARLMLHLPADLPRARNTAISADFCEVSFSTPT